MGYGDEIIGSGLARGAWTRGKRIAFGDGKRIIWSRQAHEIYRNNMNVAPPGSEGADDLEWIAFYKGRRIYGHVERDHWVFHPWQPLRGEIYFAEGEEAAVLNTLPRGLPVAPVVIEPTVKPLGACVGDNKQWPVDRYMAVKEALHRAGEWVVTLGPDAQCPIGAQRLVTPTFRSALVILKHAKLYIGPEGGLHHAAAAFGIPAVVIFGGFNSPGSTGYPWHTNLTAGGEPCGMIAPCPHCAEAMRSISVERVVEAAFDKLAEGANAGVPRAMVPRR